MVKSLSFGKRIRLAEPISASPPSKVSRDGALLIDQAANGVASISLVGEHDRARAQLPLESGAAR